MKATKHYSITLQLTKEETDILNECLFKVLAVETSITPHVVRTLKDNEIKILQELKKAIGDE